MEAAEKKGKELSEQITCMKNTNKFPVANKSTCETETQTDDSPGKDPSGVRNNTQIASVSSEPSLNPSDIHLTGTQGSIQRFFSKNKNKRKSLEECMLEVKTKQEEEKMLKSEANTLGVQDSDYFKHIVVDYLIYSSENNDNKSQIMRNAILDFLNVATENK